MAVDVAEILQIEDVEYAKREGKAVELTSFSRLAPLTVTPTLVFMAGFAGAGKTTLAKKLMERLSPEMWEVLHKDDFKLERLARGEDTERAGWNAFEELFARTEDRLIHQGKSVIIDTCGYPAFILNNLLNILAKHHATVYVRVILCIADKETRTKRLQQRGSVFLPYVSELPAIPDDSEAKVTFSHLPPDKLELDTTQPFCRYNKKVLKKALKYVLAGQPGSLIIEEKV